MHATIQPLDLVTFSLFEIHPFSQKFNDLVGEINVFEAYLIAFETFITFRYFSSVTTSYSR